MTVQYHRVARQFYGRPLLITPDAAETISSFLLSRMRGGDFQAGRGGGGENDAGESREFFEARRRDDGTFESHSPRASRFYGETPMSEDGTRRPMPYRRTAEGVAIITLVGELCNRGAWVGASSGLISYEGTKYALATAARDTRVKAILLDLESPGGQAVGCFEAADAVRAAAAIKPVWAVVNGLAASAAYAMASAATRIVTMPTGISGSIGVVLMHFDFSAFLKEEGIKPTMIFAGDHKVDGNPYEPLPPAVRDDLKAEVNAFYDLFVKAVAKGRTRMSEAAIRGTEARTFMGEDAVKVGLADAVGTFESALAELSSRAGGSRSIPSNTRTNMTDDEKTARMDERARIKAIISCNEAKGRHDQALALALETNLTETEAKAVLAASPQKNSLAERMEGRKELNLDAETGRGGPRGGNIDAGAIYASRRQPARTPQDR